MIITVGINFSQTNWPSFLLKIDYKKELLGKLIDPNFSNFSNDQHDVVFSKKNLIIKKSFGR